MDDDPCFLVGIHTKNKNFIILHPSTCPQIPHQFQRSYVLVVLCSGNCIIACHWFHGSLTTKVLASSLSRFFLYPPPQKASGGERLIGGISPNEPYLEMNSRRRRRETIEIRRIISLEWDSNEKGVCCLLVLPEGLPNMLSNPSPINQKDRRGR
jgi:hypothetical protein